MPRLHAVDQLLGLVVTAQRGQRQREVVHRHQRVRVIDQVLVDSGESVYYQVIPKYRNRRDVIPEFMSIIAIGSRGNTCFVSIKNLPGGDPNAPKC